MVIAVVPDHAAGHIALALELYQRTAAREHIPVPAEVRQLAEAMRSAARSGQERTTLAAAVEVPDDDSVSLLDVPAVARRLRVSDRTVRRLIQSGRLASVTVGSRRRVRPADLTAYIAAMEVA